MDCGLALWDVLYRCHRESSADNKIQTPEANDFSAFYRSHARITRVFFASAEAEKHYCKLLPPGAGGPPPECFSRLPSTSGAYARKFEWKLERWQAVKDAVEETARVTP